MNQNFQVLFTLYGNFLEVDAIASLSSIGRNREIIAQYLKVFSNIVNNDKNLKKNLQELVKIQKDYINKNSNIKIQINSANKFQDHIARRLNQDIEKAFKTFYESAKLYYIHRKNLTDNDLKLLYKKNIKEYFINSFKDVVTDAFLKDIDNLINEMTPKKEALLKQALMEFNNALAHVYNALIQKKVQENIQKAQVHLQRASLDFNKAIIKDLSYLNKLNNEAETIKRLRINEYGKIGENALARNVVVDNYKKEIMRILNCVSPNS